MLKEVDQNANNMGSNSNSPDPVHRSHLAIHQTNLFQPHKFTVTSIATSPSKVYLAARRGYLDHADVNHPFSQLDIYEIDTKTHPKHVLTIIEYENFTGLAWLDEKRLITVSQQATINLYSVHAGSKIRTYTSDYGPITCMRYSLADDLLVTGTEYGFAVGYRINPTIECVGKMVKLNEPIIAIDVHLSSREIPVNEPPIIKKKTVLAKKPGKRKRSESSDESEDEEDADSATQDVYLATTNVTIFGACANRVVAWDYHKKTIVDSVVSENQVCSLLTLKNGDFVIGDSEGYLGIYDNNSFTCRQNERILKSSVTCLARDEKSSVVLAAGKEPIITVLKRNASSESEDEFMLFEQIRDHTAQVNGALCATKKEFFTCSQDNSIMKFRISKSDGHRKLKRFSVKQNYQSKIHCSSDELLLIFGKSLHLYNMDQDTHFRSEIVSYPIQHSLTEPRRSCSVKASILVHAATFDDKWICYSTSKGITTIDRPGLSRIGVPSQNLPCCHILKLCQSGRFLVAGQYKTLTITKLDNQQTNEERSHNNHIESKDSEPQADKAQSKPQEHKTIIVDKLKGYIRNIFYHDSSNRLIVTCGTTFHLIYVYELPSISENGKNQDDVKLVYRTSLLCSPSSHLTLNHNEESDTNLYIHTPRNQVIKHDILSKKFNVDPLDQQVGKISGLPKETNILGLLVLSRRYGLLYDSNYIYKLDMDVNEVVNTTPKYENINMICNTIFDKHDEILIV